MRCVKQLQPKQIQGYSLLILVILVLGGCVPTTSQSETSVIAVTATDDQINLPTPMIPQEVTKSAIATSTPHLTTTLILPTQTPSPTTSSTNTRFIEPTPTLTSEQKADNFTQLMVENGGCELPCWWGIVPGETEIKTISERFVPQGLVWWEEWEQLDASRSGSGALVAFSTEESIIQSIEVRGGSEGDNFMQDWERYSLDQVLARYGVPSQVFVYHLQQADPGPLFFHLLLFYETSGIEIDYIGKAQQATDGKSQACPNLSNVDGINLFLYQPEKIDNVVELVLPPETVDFVTSSGTVYDLIKWEQTVGTSLEAFYETFKDGKGNNCFEFTMHTYR